MKTTPRFPRLRAVVRALTSPRRVWFWTTTFPVLLAPVMLYLVMRPGVEFCRMVEVGRGNVTAMRQDDTEVGRKGTLSLQWPGVWAFASFWVPHGGEPAFLPEPGSHQFGPLAWLWGPDEKIVSVNVPWFGFSVGLYH